MQSAKEQFGDKLNAAKRRLSNALSDIQRNFLLSNRVTFSTSSGITAANRAINEAYLSSIRSVYVQAFLEKSEACITDWFYTLLAIATDFPGQIGEESAVSWAKAIAVRVITEDVKDSCSEFLPQLLMTLDRLVDEELLRQLPQSAEPEPAQSSSASAATWDTIEISFLSDERVQIRNGGSSATCNYGELGFEDHRGGKPNLAWETLRELAEQSGVIREARQGFQARPKLEKRIQEIRKALRKYFDISADPIPFVEGAGYRACFKIVCAPSFPT